MTRVVLASASPGRRKVLRQAGIDPLVSVSGVDEDAVIARLDPEATPGDVTTALAAAKADAVAHALDPDVAADCVVIGCDSMLYRDGVLLGKPASADAARDGWRQMAGKSGQLYTGHCLIRLRDNVITYRAADATCTTVRFGTPSAADLDAYVEHGEPLAVAGGFTLDGLGGWFIDGVEGDPSSVIGIGLPLTRRLLQHAGLSISQLWQANPV
ncbi:Maf family protein [Mycobacterium sp.]|uniref:Maf family protein n=1 Tax=Mycobacterium sp. TaxID=1785 RepID=UPI002BB5C588|nr:Maf family nucleotide pyrophosphatase [Mycobacterium sp.]HKP40981.1 Maf family nucleotide pyrophosphatase [Mycobacterium sp.]